jgi:hypothetical protein
LTTRASSTPRGMLMRMRMKYMANKNEKQKQKNKKKRKNSVQFSPISVLFFLFLSGFYLLFVWLLTTTQGNMQI